MVTTKPQLPESLCGMKVVQVAQRPTPGTGRELVAGLLGGAGEDVVGATRDDPPLVPVARPVGGGGVFGV